MTRNGFSVRRNGAYKLRKHLGDFRPPHADDHAVGLLKIVERRPFLEKLRIAGHIALAAGQFLQPRRNAGGGADGHGAFGDHDGIRPQVRGDGIDHFPEGRQIGRAIVGRRRADGQKTSRAVLTAAAGSVVKCSRSASTLRATSSARPGS